MKSAKRPWHQFWQYDGLYINNQSRRFYNILLHILMYIMNHTSQDNQGISDIIQTVLRDFVFTLIFSLGSFNAFFSMFWSLHQSRKSRNKWYMKYKLFISVHSILFVSSRYHTYVHYGKYNLFIIMIVYVKTIYFRMDNKIFLG